MRTEFLIYLIDIVDSVKDTAKIVFIFSVVVMAIMGVIYAVSVSTGETEISSKIPKLFIRAVVTAAVSCMVDMFTPSSKSVAAMYVIPRIEKSETVQNISECLRTMSEEWLKNIMNNSAKPPETE